MLKLNNIYKKVAFLLYAGRYFLKILKKGGDSRKAKVVRLKAKREVNCVEFKRKIKEKNCEGRCSYE